MIGERSDECEMTEIEPSVSELWALLQEQRAKIARLEVALATHKAAEPAVESTAARPTSPSGESAALQPEASQPALARNGWRTRRGRTQTANGHQRLLAKPDDGTPMAIERRLSRLGLLKAAAVGVAGMAALEAEATHEAAPAAAATAIPLTYRNFSASGGIGTAFSTATNGYNVGLDVSGLALGVRATGNNHGVLGITNGGSGWAGIYGRTVQDSALGVWGQSQTVSNGQAVPGDGIGVQGDSNAGIGVRGIASGRKQVSPILLVGGVGVQGESWRGGTGVYGFDEYNTGVGVQGVSWADANKSSWGAGTGVLGRGKCGVKGESAVDDGYGVRGSGKGLGTGIYGETLTPQGGPGYGYGVYGQAGDGYGVFGRSVDSTGQNPGRGVGVHGQSGTDAGVAGESVTGVGVYGIVTGNTGFGVEGISYADPGQGALGNGIGVSGSSGGGVGVKGTSNGAGVWGQSNGSRNTGVYGIQTTNDGFGVAGRSYSDGTQTMLGNGTGVWGDTGTGKGVLGTASFGEGVHGTSTSGNGVAGDGGTVGVLGTSASGRGGVFSGGAAQVQLLPAAGNHPASGLAGDLFVDSSNNLWFCQGGSTWVQLGAGSGGGGGGNGGPLTGHSTVVATPGVYGYNDTNDSSSIGVSGASVDTHGNPGHGIGVQGSTYDGAGVKGWTLGGTGILGISYADTSETTLGIGTGVQGKSAWGFGVAGYSQNSIGVDAASDASNAPALHGRNSSDGTGVQGISAGFGIGVDGATSGGIAVNGYSTSGRGAVFGGGRGPLRLLPGGPTPPTTGQAVGDFYVDNSGNLWYWKGGPTWIQLA